MVKTLCMMTFILGALLCLPLNAENPVFETDTFPTGEDTLTLTFVGHGTLMMEWKDRVIHVDPVSRMADYSMMPDADLILVTHAHGDHLDPGAIKEIRKEETRLLASVSCMKKLPEAEKIENGDTREVFGIFIEAVPAYNIQHLRNNGEPYHKRGEGNGYILTLGNKRVYVAGDTECIPEMSGIKAIDIAFLPMNLPYTMSPEMAARAATAFSPRIVYPYHYGGTDTSRLVELLREEKEIEVRIRNFYPGKK